MVDCQLTESEQTTKESIQEQKQAMVLVQQHKEEAQAGLEYYKSLTLEAESIYKHIFTMQQLKLTPEIW